MHTAAPRRCAYRVSVDQCPGVLVPALAMPQARQRRAAEDMERLTPGARQAMGIAPPPAGSVMAVGAGRRNSEDTRERVWQLAFLVQNLDRTPPLSGCQRVGLRQALMEGFSTHDGILHTFPSLS